MSGVAIDDDLVGRPQHTLHRLEIEALTHQIGFLLILFEHIQEAVGLTVGFSNDPFLVGLRFLQDPLHFTAGFRNDLVGIW